MATTITIVPFRPRPQQPNKSKSWFSIAFLAFAVVVVDLAAPTAASPIAFAAVIAMSPDLPDSEWRPLVRPVAESCFEGRPDRPCRDLTE